MRALLRRAIGDALQFGAAALERNFGHAQLAHAVIGRSRAFTTLCALDKSVGRVRPRANIDRPERAEADERKQQPATADVMPPADECRAAAVPVRSAKADGGTAITRRDNAHWRSSDRAAVALIHDAYRAAVARIDDADRSARTLESGRNLHVRIHHRSPWSGVPAKAGRRTDWSTRHRALPLTAPRRAHARIVATGTGSTRALRSNGCDWKRKRANERAND